MLLKTIIDIFFRYLSIVSAFLVYSSILTIYMQIYNIRWDFWPENTFILLMLIFSVVSIILTALYYLLVYYLWNKRHLPCLLITIETFIGITVFHFLEDPLLDYLFHLSSQNNANWLISMIETYTIIIPICLVIIFYALSFIVRNKSSN